MKETAVGRWGWIERELNRLDEQGIVRRKRRVVGLGGGECEIDGRRLKNFAANDYLDLAHHPQVVAAAERALQEAGTGAGSSALVTGRTDWHASLEERLAAFEGEPAVALFPTGYAANLGTVSALVAKEDVIFSDRLNHASLIDGCRLSGAAIRIYDHDHLEPLEEMLRGATEFRRRFILTDSLFSMDGVAAPLPDLCDLADRFDAGLIIDEAHATGLFGRKGRGLAEEFGVEKRVAVRVGTLSKAVGSLGGFVAGPQPLIDWLWNRARTQMFSTAMPPASCAAACAAIDIIEQEPERRAHLRTMADRLRRRLTDRGWQMLPGGMGPVIPLILGARDAAVEASAKLEQKGLFVPAIRPPSVPEGTSRLRISLSAAHRKEEIDHLADAIEEVCEPMRIESPIGNPKS